MSEFNRPSLPGPRLFESFALAEDPADRSEAATRVATLLVRGTSDACDDELVERVLTLTDEHGLDLVAELWAHSPAGSLPGALWRLYLLRTWVRAEPTRAAREFAAGKQFSLADEVVAGVVDPPGPEEVAQVLDNLVRGLVVGDLSDVLDRAAAFARLVGIGRASLGEEPPHSTWSAARLIQTSISLRDAARAERAGTLQ